MLLIAGTAWGQKSITAVNTPITENFTMGNSAAAPLPIGFRVNTAPNWTTGTSVTTLAAGTTGTGAVTGSSGGGTYNFADGVTATSTDRALGFLTSGNFTSPRYIVFAFINNTGSTVSAIDVSFNYEKYRNGTRAFDWAFFHGGTAGNVATAAATGDQAFPADVNSNAVNPAASIAKTIAITGLNIVNGATYYLCWSKTGVGGSSNGQAIGIDNFSITAKAACAAPTVSATTSVANNATTGADLSGTVTAIGGATVKEVGFNYSTASDLTGVVTSNTTGLAVSAVPYPFSKTLSGLAANTLYYYRAYAINSCSSPQTSYSHTTGYPSFATVSLAPTPSVADNIQETSFRANWTAPTGQGSVAYTYHLQIDDNIDFSSPIYNDETVATTHFTQGSLTGNTTYYYRIRIKNAGGYSAWSGTQTVTTTANSTPVVTASSFTGTVNVSFSQNIIATNVPDSYAIVAGHSLPSGLSLNTATGAITGTPTTAGSFTTNVTATKDASTSTPTAISFTIEKGTQTISGLAATQTKAYGDADYTLSATASSGLAVTYTSSNTAVATITGNTVTITGAGTSTITAHQVGNTNYNEAADVTKALTISKKQLSITGLAAQDKVYDQTTSVVVTDMPVYSGLVNGDSFSVSGTVTWAFPDKNVGAGKTLVPTGNYNSPSANYTVLQPTLQAAITKKDITITAITAEDKAYDGTVTAAFSNVSSTSVFAGDTVTFAVSGSFSDANAGLDKSVTIVAINLLGTDGGNYNIAHFPTGLTADITKINQTITFNTVPTVNVGGTVNLVTYATTTSGLALSYNSSVPAVASISGATLTGNNSGSTIVTVSQVGDTNYNEATSVQQTVNVVEMPVALAQWNFFGLSNVATASATTKASELANNPILSRGAGAPASAGGNSFRTDGFKNDAISVTNTDYFQTSFTASQKIMSLTAIDAIVTGSAAFAVDPGVASQFAYSFDNSNYTLINIPETIIGTNKKLSFNVSNVAALQDIQPNTTVYFRFYAKGQSTTGTFGFYSENANADKNGLEFKGRFKPTSVTWDGSAWSNLNGPVKSQNAVIDGAYTQTATSNPIEVNNLNITNNGSLTILANQGITVNGDITMPDNKITIESDGSLVQTKITDGNSAKKIIAKRKVNMKVSDYTYWSSPVADQVLLNTVNPNAANSSGGFSQGSPNNRTYQYNEVNDTFKATLDAIFLPAKGYAIKGKSTYGTAFTPDELLFSGNLHNGDYSIQVQKSKNTKVNGISTEHGYNLVGNPYPSNIDFDKLHDLDNGTGIKNSAVILGKAWFWTNIPGAPATQAGSAYVSNNYATYSLAGGAPATGADDVESPIPTKFIKVAQGFIVQMRTAAPTGNTPDFGILKFDNSIRSNDSSSYFYNNNKNAESQLNRYWVKLVSPNNVVNTILLAHIEGATNGYDPDYDSELLTVADDSFYSKLTTQKLQIQARNNPLFSGDVIQLGTKYSVNGVYKIKLGNKEGVFKTDQKIYLVDKLTNTYTDITTQEYAFSANKGIDEGRFEIVYQEKLVLGTDSSKKTDFEVYRDGTDYVMASSKVLGEIRVYDAAGRFVISQKTTSKSTRLDVSSLVNGIYIIKAENSGDFKTKKMIK